MGPSMLSDEKLPYPTRPLQVQGGIVEEYVIPEEKKAEVLAMLYLYQPVPSMDEELYDIHEGKKFRVRDFRVTREGGHNFLVSPYYPNSGGTFIDWFPADDATNKRKTRGRGGLHIDRWRFLSKKRGVTPPPKARFKPIRRST